MVERMDKFSVQVFFFSISFESGMIKDEALQSWTQLD
jgi:hypothetical protein